MGTRKEECKTFQPDSWGSTRCRSCFRERDEHPSYEYTISTFSGMTLSSIDEETRVYGSDTSRSVLHHNVDEYIEYSENHSASTKIVLTESPPFLDDINTASGSSILLFPSIRDESRLLESLTPDSYSENSKHDAWSAESRIDYDERLHPSPDDEFSLEGFEVDDALDFFGDSSRYSTYEDLSSLLLDSRDKRKHSLDGAHEANEFQCMSSLVESANVNKSLDSLFIQKEAGYIEELEPHQARVRSRSLGAEEGLYIEEECATNAARGIIYDNSQGLSTGVCGVKTDNVEMAEVVGNVNTASTKSSSDPVRKHAQQKPAAAASTCVVQKGNKKSVSVSTVPTPTAKGADNTAKNVSKECEKDLSSRSAQCPTQQAAQTKLSHAEPNENGDASQAFGDEFKGINRAEVEELKDLVKKLHHQVEDMGKQAEDLVQENQKLRSLQLPVSLKDQDPYKSLIDAQNRLAESEEARQSLKERNICLEAEIEELRVEIDEARDTFREGDNEEFRELQKQLEAASKNCRVMQYRLRKSERKIEDLESERKLLEEKLHSLSCGGTWFQEGNGGNQDLYSQLKVAKDVSVRLHMELENLDEKRGRIEEENQLLRRKLVDSENQRKELKREAEKVKIELHRREVELLKRKLGQIEEDELNEERRWKMKKLKEGPDVGAEYDVSSLMSELQETIERERDVQHQLQLTEEESAVMRRKLGEIEQERERVDFELEKYKMHFGTLENPKKEGEAGDISEKEAELRLQLMMVEQEATVMRRKMCELETRNEELNSALERDDIRPAKTKEAEEAADGGDNNELRQRLDEVEQHAEHLRHTLLDAEAEIDHLSAKLSKYEELTTAGILCKNDSREDIDLKQHLRMREEENMTIRKRLVEAEIITRMLEDEVSVYKRLNEDALGHGTAKGKGHKAEAKLKSQISLLKQENERMRKQVVEVEIQNDNLNEELMGYKKGESSARAPPSSPDHITESDRLPALQEKVNHLEEQLADLVSTVKGKEQVQEQQEAELKLAQKTIERASTEATVKHASLEKELNMAVEKQEALLKQLENVERHAQCLQEELKQSSEPAQKEAEHEEHLTDTSKEHRKEEMTLEKKVVMVPTQTPQEALSSCSDDTCYREREKELLRFELNECQAVMAEWEDQVRTLKMTVTKERHARAKEKEEYEQRIKEIEEDREKSDKRKELEKENIMEQQVSEAKAWKKEKQDLYEQLEQFKEKTDVLHRKLQTEQSNWSKEDFDNKGASSGNTTPTSMDLFIEKTELEHAKQKLTDKAHKLESDSSKYKIKNEEMGAKIELLTAQNEELRASRDILTEERALLHSKLTEAQQEQSEMEVALKKDRVMWEKERATIKFDFENERKRRENEMKKAKDEIERLRREKSQSEFGHKHYEAKLKEFERKAKELHEMLKKKEEAFARDKAKIIEEQSRHFQSKTRDLQVENNDLRTTLQRKEDEIQRKVRELQLKIDEHRHETEQLRNKLKNTEKDQQELQRRTQELEDTWTKEKEALTKSEEMTEKSNSQTDSDEGNTLATEKQQLQNKLLANENEWRQERAQLAEVMEKLKTSLRAREESWRVERTNLLEESRTLQSALNKKDELVRAEKEKFSIETQQLRRDLETRCASWENERREFLAHIAQQASNSDRCREETLSEENVKLLTQLNALTKELADVREERKTAECQLKEKEAEHDRERVELVLQLQAQEKISKTEIATLQLRFDTEIASMRDEKSRLEGNCENEAKEKEHHRLVASDVQSELSSVKAQFDNERKAWERQKGNLQKQAEDAKDGKRLATDLRRSVESLQQKLANEEKRRSEIQRTYVSEKSSWEIERSELQVKITRLEQNVKGSSKKTREKVEGQLARIQESWEKERGEQRRLLAVSHGKTMDLQRQVDALEKSLLQERKESHAQLTSERREFEDERNELLTKIRELEEENRLLREWDRRSKEIQERHKQDHRAWQEERAYFQRKLVENEKTKKKDKTRIDDIVQEFEKLKKITTYVDFTQQDGVLQETSHDYESKLRIPETDPSLSPRSMTSTSLQTSSSHFSWYSVQQTCEPQLTKFEQALREIEKVTDDLAQYQADIVRDKNTRLKRSKSHSDVSEHGEEIVQAMDQFYKSSTLSRPAKPDNKPPVITQPQESTKERLIFPPAETVISENVNVQSQIERLGNRASEKVDDDATSKDPGSPGYVVSEKVTYTTSISHSTHVPKVTSSVATGGIATVTSTTSPTTESIESDTNRGSPPSKLIAIPVLTRRGLFNARGMLRETEKQPSLPWMQPDGTVINDSRDLESRLREGRVISTKKMFEKGDCIGSRSRDASPVPVMAGRTPITVKKPVSKLGNESNNKEITQPVTKGAVVTPVTSSRIDDTDLSSNSTKNVGALTPPMSSSTNRQMAEGGKIGGKPPVPAKPQKEKKIQDTMPTSWIHESEQSSGACSQDMTHTKPLVPPSALYINKRMETTFDGEGSITSPTSGTYAPSVSRTPTPPTRDTQFVPENLNAKHMMQIIPGNLPRTKSQMQYQATVRQIHGPQASQLFEKSKFSPRTARAQFFAESPIGHSQRPDKFDRSARSRSLSPPAYRLADDSVKLSLPPPIPESVGFNNEKRTSMRDRSPSPQRGHSMPTQSTQGLSPNPPHQIRASSASSSSTWPTTTTSRGNPTKPSTETRTSPKMGTKSINVYSQAKYSSHKTTSIDQRKITKSSKSSSRSAQSAQSGTSNSSSENIFAQITADVAPSLTARFPRPQPINRRPPSRWISRRSTRNGDQFMNSINGEDSTKDSRGLTAFDEHPTMHEALEIFRRFCETTV